MEAAGLPTAKGSSEPISSAKVASALADEIGYPVIIKAAAGGGVRGDGDVPAAARGGAPRAARREHDAVAVGLKAWGASWRSLPAGNAAWDVLRWARLSAREAMAEA